MAPRLERFANLAVWDTEVYHLLASLQSRKRVLRLGEIGPDPQRLLVLFDRLLHPAQCHQGQSQIVVGNQSIRILRYVVSPECFSVCINTAPSPDGMLPVPLA